MTSPPSEIHKIATPTKMKITARAYENVVSNSFCQQPKTKYCVIFEITQQQIFLAINHID